MFLSMPKIPVLIFSAILASAIHVDWHLARPAHHRLSLEWPYHWLATALVFAATGWMIARFWPAIRWRMGAIVFIAAVVLAQGIEPVLEMVFYMGRFSYPDEPLRWAAFGRAIAASTPAFVATLWLCVPRSRVSQETG